MTEESGTPECGHVGLAHPSAYVAGLAIGAVRSEIQFAEAYAPAFADWVSLRRKGHLAGLRIGSDSTWATYPLNSLRLITTGNACEAVLLGHMVEGNALLDFKTWLDAIGDTGPATQAHVESVIEGDFDKVLEYAEFSIRENSKAAQQLADALAEASPRALPYDQVAQFYYDG